MKYIAYRGEYGTGLLRTRKASLTFDKKLDVARLYMFYPNQYTDRVKEPKVIRAELTINNPVGSADDPFLNLSIFGPDAWHFARKFEAYIMATNNWEDRFGDFYSIDDLHEAEPTAINDLYCIGYPILDDYEAVEALKKKYDGAICAGYGENVDSIEYRVFDKSQINILEVTL